MGSEIETVMVPRQPNLAAEFFRAAITSGGRPGLTGGLPTTRLTLPAARIDRDNLIAYQRLCGFTISDVLPPTYPHLLGFGLQVKLMAAPEFPLPLAGLIHLENEITQYQALTADDRPDVTVYAENLQLHPKGTTVELVTTMTQDGDISWSSRSTYLRRGAGTPASDRESTTPARPTGAPVARWKLPAGLGRAYAAVSGDVNPIHLHPLTARMFGFRGAIAHGMWSAARVLAMWGMQLRQPHTSHVRFHKPIVLPTTVALLREPGSPRAALVSARNRDRVHLILGVRGGPTSP